VPEEHAQGRSVFEDASTLDLQRRLSGASADVLAPALRLVAFLRAQVEGRTPAAIRLQRRARLGLVALLALVAIVALVRVMLRPANLALHKTVTASSVRGNSGPPSGVVDGTVESSGVTFCTNDDQDPWLVVDLGAPHPIHAIVVYNRADGYFDHMLPFAVDVSGDAKTWTTVGKEAIVFTQSEPATFPVGGAASRYVRVHSLVAGHAVCFNEIEIH
jgi:hypothetical protein